MLRINRIVILLVLTTIFGLIFNFHPPDTFATTESPNEPMSPLALHHSKWYVSYGGVTDWQPLATSSIPIDKLAFGNFDADETTDVFSTVAMLASGLIQQVAMGRGYP